MKEPRSGEHVELHQEADAPTTWGLKTDRVETLADGIFAVAMTLLVLAFHVPPRLAEAQSVLDVFRQFADQVPTLLAYIMSFLLLGVYWVSHHVQFHYIRFANRTLLWINVVFFLLIVLVPFTTQLIGLYWYKPTMALLYGGQLILIALVIALHWWYGTRSHQLTGTSIDRHLVRSGLRRILVAPAICLIAIALCWFNPLISIICYACIPVYYVLPGHLDEHWWPFHHQHRQEGETR